MANKIELKKINRNNIFHCIYHSDGISRQEIMAQTGLSMPTVLSNLSSLTEDNLIVTDGVFKSTGGRRADIIRLNAEARCAIGIDITRNHITIAVIDLLGNIIAGGKRETLAFEAADCYYDQICSRVDEILNEGKIDRTSILGVGISLPSIVDRKHNKVTYSKEISAPEDICQEFVKRLSYDVEVFNDANSGALAESFADKGKSDVFYLMLSNSVGGAMIDQNGINLGANCRSGEIGHTKIMPEGRTCFCGQKGCVNAYCSAKVLSDQAEGNLGEFFTRVNLGDPQAVTAFEEYLRYLAITVVNIRMMYDCEIILGGYVGGYMERYMNAFRHLVGTYDPYQQDGMYVWPCRYRMEASAVGAALNFIQKFITEI